MASGEVVLALEEEGAGQLQSHPHQPRRLDQHGVEGADGLVQQRLAGVFVNVGVPRGTDRREAVEEERVGLDRLLIQQRPQNRQRVGEAAGIDQCLRLGLAGLAGRNGRNRSGGGGRQRYRLFLRRAPGRRGEREAGGNGKRAEEKASCGYRRSGEEG